MRWKKITKKKSAKAYIVNMGQSERRKEKRLSELHESRRFLTIGACKDVMYCNVFAAVANAVFLFKQNEEEEVEKKKKYILDTVHFVFISFA